MNNQISVLDKHRDDIQRINQTIEHILKENISPSNYFILYSALSDGKRIRPLLFLMVCKIFGICSDSAYFQSTVYELIHAASLMHDDVLDDAQLRRSRPTVNALWGNHMAVLGGDNLYITALRLALETKNLEYISLIIETVREMTEGQILELQNSFNYKLDRNTYFRIIQQKTASLISAAMKGAAIFCDLPKNVREDLSKAGLYMGTAFQMVDDLLDITGNQKELGKEIGKDIKEGKITLPLIYLMEKTGQSEIQNLRPDMDQECLNNLISRIHNKILENGIASRITQEAQELCRRAEELLDKLPECLEKTYLMEVNSFIVSRNF